MSNTEPSWTRGQYQPSPQSLLWRLGQGLVLPAVMGSVLVFVIQNAASDLALLFGESAVTISAKRVCAYLIAIGYGLYLCLSFLTLNRAKEYGTGMFVLDIVESVLGFFAVFAVGFITATEPFGSFGVNLGIALIGLIALLRSFFPVQGAESVPTQLRNVRWASIPISVIAVLVYFGACGDGKCPDRVPPWLYVIDLLLIFAFYFLIARYAKARFPRIQPT